MRGVGAHIRRKFIQAAAGNDAFAPWEKRWLDRIGRLYYLNQVRLKHYNPAVGIEEQSKKFCIAQRQLHSAVNPTDATLHGIADRLQAIQWAELLPARRRGQPPWPLLPRVHHVDRHHARQPYLATAKRGPAEDVVTEALRDLARWLYRQLEAEYDHLTSDETIEERIIVHEYMSTEVGRRFG